MDEKASGIIVRVRPLTESSLVVSWLTPGCGRMATVAKGARRSKSPFQGRLDLFHSGEFRFVRSRRSELHTLREVDSTPPPAVLRRDYRRLAQVSYAVQLIEAFTETETPLPDLFGLFQRFLDHVGRQPCRARSIYAFELKLLADQGLAPDSSSGHLGPAAFALAESLTDNSWEDLALLEPEAAAVRQLARFLNGFLHQQLGRIPTGRPAALGDPPVRTRGLRKSGPPSTDPPCSSSAEVPKNPGHPGQEA